MYNRDAQERPTGRAGHGARADPVRDRHAAHGRGRGPEHRLVERAGDAELPRRLARPHGRRGRHLRGAADHQRPGRDQLPERRRDAVGRHLRQLEQDVLAARRLQLLREPRAPRRPTRSTPAGWSRRPTGPRASSTRWSPRSSARTCPRRRPGAIYLGDRQLDELERSRGTRSPSTATTTTTPAATGRTRRCPASPPATRRTRRRRSAASTAVRRTT